MGRSTEDYLDSLLMEAMASEENDIYEELGEDEPFDPTVPIVFESPEDNIYAGQAAYTPDMPMQDMYEQGMYIPYRNEVLALAKEPSLPGWKEFSTFKGNQFIIRMADPKGVISYEGLSARETLAKLLTGGFNGDAEAALKDLDARLNGGLNNLDPDTYKAYVAPSSYKVTRD